MLSKFQMQSSPIEQAKIIQLIQAKHLTNIVTEFWSEGGKMNFNSSIL